MIINHRVEDYQALTDRENQIFGKKRMKTSVFNSIYNRFLIKYIWFTSIHYILIDNQFLTLM